LAANNSISSKSETSPDVNSTSNNKTSNSSLSSLKNKLINENSTDELETPKSANKQKLTKSRSYSSCDYEITKKSIENIIYEHALFLLNNYRIKQLFGMFANLNGINVFKWLQQYQ
jgi:hypothetical protein